MPELEYLDEVENPDVWVRGPVYVKERETGLPVFATSDIQQIGYLQYRGFLPYASVMRTWKVNDSMRKKIFMVYEDSTILRKILDDLKHNIGGAKALLDSYDKSRIQIRNLSRS